MKPLLLIVAIFIFMLTPVAQANTSFAAPDLVVVNATIHTMDESRPVADAIAILLWSIETHGGVR